VITQFVVGEFFLKFSLPSPLFFFSFFRVKKRRMGLLKSMILDSQLSSVWVGSSKGGFSHLYREKKKGD
jgi:hypothetical protein